MRKRLAIEELHGDERLALVLSDLVDRADVRVVERRCRLGFAPEAFQGLLVAGHVFGKELQSDETMEGRVLSFIDHAHAAAAQFLDDAVMRDGLTDHGASKVG